MTVLKVEMVLLDLHIGIASKVESKKRAGDDLSWWSGERKGSNWEMQRFDVVMHVC